MTFSPDTYALCAAVSGATIKSVSWRTPAIRAPCGIMPCGDSGWWCPQDTDLPSPRGRHSILSSPPFHPPYCGIPAYLADW